MSSKCVSNTQTLIKDITNLIGDSHFEYNGIIGWKMFDLFTLTIDALTGTIQFDNYTSKIKTLNTFAEVKKTIHSPKYKKLIQQRTDAFKCAIALKQNMGHREKLYSEKNIFGWKFDNGDIVTVQLYQPELITLQNGDHSEKLTVEQLTEYMKCMKFMKCTNMNTNSADNADKIAKDYSHLFTQKKSKEKRIAIQSCKRPTLVVE
jgi:hypothetical protein